MFIQTEATPNPATVKFLPGRDLLPGETANFPSEESALRSPLARRLFAVEGVAGVLIGGDFVAVTKAEEKEWFTLKPAVLGALLDHLQSGEVVLEGSGTAGESGGNEGFAAADAEIVATIRELIDTRVRPAVAQDGGDIVFRGFERGVVYLHMQGACSGCPSSTATLKMGIENLLRHYVPEVTEVRAVA